MRLLGIFLLLLSFQSLAGIFKLQSPDRKITLEILEENGEIRYSVKKNGTVIVEPSKLGMMIRDTADMSKDLSILNVIKSKKNERWEQPWGQKRFVLDHYEQISLHTEHAFSKIKMHIEFRVYNDGVGFRYHWPSQNTLNYFEIWDEVTEFNFQPDDEAWWIPAFQDNRYEYLFKKNRLKDIHVVHTPLTIELKNGYTVALHEANLIDFASMALKSYRNGTLKADLVPWSDGIRVKAFAPHQSPWRAIIIADAHKDLIESDMVLNLNEPSKIKDTTWIETGKYIGMWWGIHLGKFTWNQGSKHGATTENVKQYIDFAADNGFKGVLVEGWNYGWDGDWMANGNVFRFSQPYPAFDAKWLSDYGKARGVSIVGHHETSSSTKNYESQLEEAFNFLNRHNMKVVKTGYVGTRLDSKEWHHGQYGVRHYTKVMELAAKKKTMLVVHEPIKHTGLERTYPNLMSSEGARGQEYDAWSSDGGNPPEHTVILPFTRLLAGPMDFTPGTFDLTFDQWRPYNRVNTTLAKQLALFVVIYSPWQMASDLPENYEKNPEAFEFIKSVPTDWEKTIGLTSKIGDYTVVARKDRNSERWFVGAISDENGRKLTIKLDFLDRGSWYKVKAYQDARNASWSTNPYAMEIYETRVNSYGSFDLHLAPGGGLALEFIKE
jgi:alpha-glucosidase